MARLRLHPLNAKEINFPHNNKETLQDLFDRFFDSLHVKEELLRDYYAILIDGEEIPKEQWKYYIIGDKEPLIAVSLKGGSGRGFFRQLLVTVAVVAATVLTQGAALPALAQIAIVTAAAVGSSLLANALFPPPDVGGMGSFDSLGYEGDSQTYTISNQSNKTNKYGSVPRVYGTHKMFPNIAANPYTELTVDPTTGRTIQNFYCIYSFGYGPLKIRDVKIGDTEIEKYNNANYRLVDLNRPATDEGEWDEELNNTFEYYKGDNESSAVGVNINSNQETAGPSTPIEEYRVERNASDKGDGDNQEILLFFTAPQGLTTFGTNGNNATRTIELLVEFAEVGTTNWKPFNDTSVAEITETVGIISDSDDSINFIASSLTLLNTIDIGRERIRQYGIAKGSTTFDSSDFIQNGIYILHGGVNIGKIASSTVISGGWRYTLDSPLEASYVARTSTQALYWNCSDGQDPATCTWDETGLETFNSLSTPWKQQEGTGGTFKISANTQSPAFFSMTIKPYTTNQIKIRVTRVRSYGGYSYRITDALTWSAINTRFDRTPIITPNRHVFMEVKIQATDQLNGTIRDLSAVATSVLPVYDDATSTWSLEETNNPAWVFADLLTGSANKRAISQARLDTDTLIEWADYCDEYPVHPTYVYEMPRFECNFILDYKATLNVMLNRVSNANGASLNIVNGKYGVLIDKKKTTPVQLFTPRNSWGFSSNRKYVELPHALKIRYVDGRSNWSVREEIVYASGYDSSNATVFEEMDTFGVTNNEQAFRFGKYNLAQVILRQETVSISVDFENLICTRGDYVLLQQDAALVGGVPARVTSVSGNDITIDDSFTDGGGSYGYTFRGVNGIYTGTLVIVDTDTATLTGTLPAVGDLIVWGEVDSITLNMVVKSIEPQSDLTATLTLVERANEIHDAESSETPPTYSPQLTTPPSDFTPPGEVESLTVDESSWACQGGGYLYYVDLTWSPPLNAAVEVYEIYTNNGSGYALSDYSSTLSYRYIVDEDDLGIEHKFKVLGVDANGNKITLGEVSEVTSTPVSKTTPPSDVSDLFINITNQVIQLDWGLISDCDVSFYRLRYSPSTTGTWASSIPLQDVTRDTSSISVQGRTGSYLIKAIDWNGNESSNAASAITSIPELFDLNVIEETNDFPTLPGSKDKVEVFSGDLILQEKVSGGMGSVEYYEEGYYTFTDLLDLGEIYTVRLQSLIEAEGFSTDDLMVNWLTLADVDAMASSSTSDWDVETYYRSTENLITMSTWTTLASVTSLDSGVEDGWTEWRKFTMGDFTGRVFQFRLKLISNKASITPRVYDGIIKSDMPDRIESYDNLTATTLGYNLVYTPAFKGPGTTPAIQITQDDASQGDYYKITNRTLDGFTIKFYDNTDTLVSRQFDAYVKGYGRKHTSVI